MGITTFLLMYVGREFLLVRHSFIGLMVYYVGMVGWGGAYNMLYLFAENETPPEMLGATFSLGMSLGLLAASLAPQIILLEMPMPILICESALPCL